MEFEQEEELHYLYLAMEIEYKEPKCRESREKRRRPRHLAMWGRRKSREYQAEKKEEKRKTKERNRERRTIHILQKSQYDGSRTNEQTYCHGRWSEYIPINDPDNDRVFWYLFGPCGDDW